MLPRTENALLRYFEPIRTSAIIPSAKVDTQLGGSNSFSGASTKRDELDPHSHRKDNQAKFGHPGERGGDTASENSHEQSEEQSSPQSQPGFARFTPAQKLEIKEDELPVEPKAVPLDQFPGLTIALLELYENLREHARLQAKDRAEAAYRKQEHALQDHNKLPKGAMLDRKVA